ncbi:cytochrome c oxidase subunit 3 [Methylocystis bryophila]|uniref:Cytochrome c oxidase subunit III n=1 Tax=Methylocystis bryophila TaxID=655015 RepID=A0A1W6MSR1_9HYPH|nr:cytochrome c oxidase subunit 3 [Methylocystis bryophila]ARN80529.1 cytochrome c oxidase subunit III [Methylocystis bryophila]BDV40575.1 cytochrome-c oxidase [Methylocystis bryophila]
MSVMGLFFLFIASVVVLWLRREGVMSANWLEEGEAVGVSRPSRRVDLVPPVPAAKVGLAVFLAVALCIFSLLTAAYFMRMDSPDWQNPPLPRILWLNTAFLIASSVALQWAHSVAERDDVGRLRALLKIAAATSGCFLLGQLWAWRELIADHYFVASNAANAFFYLLTAVHGLHLAGGLVALARTMHRAWRPVDWAALKTSVELCTIYWHFLLAVWLLMFAMLAGEMNGFGALCRRVLS